MMGARGRGCMVIVATARHAVVAIPATRQLRRAIVMVCHRRRCYYVDCMAMHRMPVEASKSTSRLC